MTRYVLDTNHVSAVLKKHPPLLGRMQSAGNSDFGVTIPSVGELWYMVFNSARIQANTNDLGEILRDFVRWQFDEPAAREFGVIKAELRRTGRPIPDVDVQIAAVTRFNSLTLLTADVHFSFVSGLKSENWLR